MQIVFDVVFLACREGPNERDVRCRPRLWAWEAGERAEISGVYSCYELADEELVWSVSLLSRCKTVSHTMSKM